MDPIFNAMIYEALQPLLAPVVGSVIAFAALLLLYRILSDLFEG